jgi:KRAB domain-containing zinc finger protein
MQYACNICQHTFSTSYNLNKHKKIHTGKKPYECFICQYKSVAKDGLLCYMKIHTGKKPFKCPHM